MLSFIIRAALLWVSLIGYCFFLRKKNINMAFAPVITLSGIGIAMFIAGILNIMPYTVLLIWLGGIGCTFISKPWRYKTDFQKSDYLCLAIFSIIVACFAVRLYGQIPTHYDAFSHWLTVVKEILKTDSLPNFKSDLIMFQGYPTGSAGFIYFICKFLGRTGDDLILFAQSLIIASCLCVFIAFIKKLDIFAIIVGIIGGIYCLVANSPQDTAIAEPLVDTLVSVLSLASLAIIIYYKDKLYKAAWVSLMVQIFLVAVKNSGIIMLLLNTALLLFFSVLYDCRSKNRLSFARLIKLGIIHSGIPACVFVLWSRHVDYVFESGASSKHTVSLENYTNIFKDKTIDQIKEILINFLNRLFSWNSTWFLLIVVAVILLFGYAVKRIVLKKKSRNELFITGGITVAYFGFMAILAAMYLLSMPYDEAVVLASYSRYEKTVVIYIVGAIILYLLHLLSAMNKGKNIFVGVSAILLSCLILFTQINDVPDLFIKTNAYQGSQRQLLENIKSDYSIPDGASCFIYGSQVEGDAGYHYFAGRYIFWNISISACSPSQLTDKKDSIKEYDYLIVMQGDDAINAYLTENSLALGEAAYKLSNN